MKKIISLALCLCVLGSMAIALAVTASADVDVTIGQEFAYNEIPEDQKDARLEWRKGHGSADGLWKYQFYALAKGIYTDMKYYSSSQYYSWNGTAATGTGALEYCLVRQYGKNFHPGTGADACKVFTCPASGTVHLRNAVSRQSEFTSESKGTPTGFAIYVEDRQVWPQDGSEYEAMTAVAPRNIECDVEVSKGDRIYFRINAMGDRASDAVNMENYVTYTALNLEDEGTTHSDSGLPTFTDVGEDITIPSLIDADTGSTNSDKTASDGLSVGAIIGIVAGVVVVAGAVVFFVLRKKKNS